MKRRILALVLLSCVVFCGGCSHGGLPDFSGVSYDSSENVLLPTTFTYSEGEEAMPPQFRYKFAEMDDYIYFEDDNTLVRLNSKTGERSYLCADPLCTHQSGCEYRLALRSIYTEDGKLFFFRKYDSGDTALVMYDIKSTKQTIICPWESSGTQIPVFTYHAPYIFYYIVVSEETDTYQVGDVLMHQMDIQTMEDRVLCSFPGGKYGYCAGIYQGDPVIMTTEQIARLSPDSGELSVLISVDDLHGSTIYCNSYRLQGDVLRFFSTDCTMPDAPKTYFWKYDLAQSTLSEVACVAGKITHSSFCYTENAIYYRISESYTLGTFVAKNSANSGELVLNYPNFYRMNYDTATVEPVFLQLPDEYKTCNLQHEFLVLGNYIYVSYNHYGPGSVDDIYYEKDFSRSLSGLMRIDIRDGSLLYVGGK